jgi:hypothetical protein
VRVSALEFVALFRYSTVTEPDYKMGPASSRSGRNVGRGVKLLGYNLANGPKI